MFDRFSDEAKDAMKIAYGAAVTSRASQMEDVHILIGCCRAQDSLAARVLLACGQDPIELCVRAEQRAAQLGRGAGVALAHLPFADNAKRVLENTLEVAQSLRHRWIGTHHMLLGLLRLRSDLSDLLVAGGLELAEATRRADEIHRGVSPPAEPLHATVPDSFRSHIDILREAQQACVELGEFELASQLRDLVHKLEHPR